MSERASEPTFIRIDHGIILFCRPEQTYLCRTSIVVIGLSLETFLAKELFVRRMREEVNHAGPIDLRAGLETTSVMLRSTS